MAKRQQNTVCAYCGKALKKPRLVAIGSGGEFYHLACGGFVPEERRTPDPATVTWEDQLVELTVVGGMLLGHLRDLGGPRLGDPVIEGMLVDIQSALAEYFAQPAA